MASTLDEKTVRHVASLARLEITDEEVALYAEQLSKILQYVEQLSELNTNDVEPTAHPLPVTNVMRDDIVQDSYDPDRALGNAPQRQDSFFRVPKVLDQESA
jgi:aspartyl-tRNA(Asn)/glutamyl-tRNA(Gln) amidotransferase subunit C